MNTALIPQNLFEIDLEQALSRGEFLLYFQPIIDARNKSVVEAEALLRWDHPELGLLQPKDFMPLIENDPAFFLLGDWILRQACEQNKKWQEQGMFIRVGVNISVRQLGYPLFAKAVQKILETTDLDAKFLELEITEKATIDNIKQNVSTLKDLKDMGVHIAIDDFGAGHTALSYLKEFPVDTIKIDKDFIEESVTSPQGNAIVKAILYLARELNFRVIAEGVESDLQLRHLLDLNCYFVQGYLFGRAIPAEKFMLNYQGNYLL